MGAEALKSLLHVMYSPGAWIAIDQDVVGLDLALGCQEIIVALYVNYCLFGFKILLRSVARKTFTILRPTFAKASQDQGDVSVGVNTIFEGDQRTYQQSS